MAERSHTHYVPPGDIHDPTNTKMLLPIPASQHSETLSGMKKEIKTIEFNLDHIQDRQDSAREYITDFRDRHDFAEQCNELCRELWPVTSLLCQLFSRNGNINLRWKNREASRLE